VNSALGFGPGVPVRCQGWAQKLCLWLHPCQFRIQSLNKEGPSLWARGCRKPSNDAPWETQSKRVRRQIYANPCFLSGYGRSGVINLCVLFVPISCLHSFGSMFYIILETMLSLDQSAHTSKWMTSSQLADCLPPVTASFLLAPSVSSSCALRITGRLCQSPVAIRMANDLNDQIAVPVALLTSSSLKPGTQNTHILNPKL